MNILTRNDIFMYVKNTYDIEPDYPWVKFPDYAVLRHFTNRKWFGVVMSVKKEKLKLDGDGNVEILNIKCDPLMVGSLLLSRGFMPAYHMNRENWVSVILDGTVEEKQIFELLDISYNLTVSK